MRLAGTSPSSLLKPQGPTISRCSLHCSKGAIFMLQLVDTTFSFFFNFPFFVFLKNFYFLFSMYCFKMFIFSYFFFSFFFILFLLFLLFIYYHLCTPLLPFSSQWGPPSFLLKLQVLSFFFFYIFFSFFFYLYFYFPFFSFSFFFPFYLFIYFLPSLYSPYALLQPVVAIFGPVSPGGRFHTRLVP